MEMLLKVYSISLRFNYFAQEVLSLRNIKLTIKVLLGALVLFLSTYCVSDFTFAWIVTNLIITWPLIYQEKKELIDNVLALIKTQIDDNLKKLPFLEKLERKGS